MKTIELISLTLKNFKGIKDLQIPFNRTTNIYGENATGKTTIADAFSWLLFDKDSLGRSDFNIKTLADNGGALHGLEHTVIGTLSVNGRKKVFQKTLKEKWQKKRGESEAQFVGHETLYYLNDVPLKLSEYKNEVSDICDELTFKLITNPLYFSQGMKWQERRAVLTEMIESVDADSVINYNRDLLPLQDLLIDTDIDTLRKILAARRKKLNDDIKALPVRIDECNNNIVDHDFNSLRKELEQKEKELEEIEKQLVSISLVSNKLDQRKQQLNNIRIEMDKIEREAQNHIMRKKRDAETVLRNREYELRSKEDHLNLINKEHTSKSLGLVAIADRVQEYRDQWNAVKAKEISFEGKSFACPTCNRLLDASDIEKQKQEMIENFNSDKAKILNEISEKGKSLADDKKAWEVRISQLDNDIKCTQEAIAELKISIEAARNDIASAANTEIAEYGNEYKALCMQYEDLEAELLQPASEQDNFYQLRDTKAILTREIDTIKSVLRQEETNKKQLARIEELKAQERQLSQQIAELECHEFLCEKFIKTRVELLESSINNRFKYVNFKMFSDQINGGLTETCEAMVNGVPFSDVNNASKINAGIDIINALCDHYQVSAPIFIDNRESINELIPTDSQIINLIVSTDKKLKIG